MTRGIGDCDKVPATTDTDENLALFLEATSPPEGYASCCDAIRDWDFRDQLGGISAPTLVIGGEFDLAAPPALNVSRRVLESMSVVGDAVLRPRHPSRIVARGSRSKKHIECGI